VNSATAILLAAVLTLAPAPQLGAQASGEGHAAAAQPIQVETAPRPVARATRTSEPIVIDGRLDEPAWLSADSLGGFIQSQPDVGHPATERTVVRILYDDRALYIGALLFETEPEKRIVSTLEKDFPGESTRDYDVFSFTLDTFHDRKNSFIYLINPYGAVRDGQTYDDSRDVNFAWNGIAQVKTQIHDWGWSLEMAIPWTTLRFDPNRADQVWGFNMLRRVRHKNEDSYWAPLDRRDPVHRMSKAGTLVGLQEPPAGRNLMIKPYLLSGNASGPGLAPGARGTDLDGGVDLKYGLTSRLTLDLTYNTDFSQVEVDQEQVNLTRFSLFFPERRDFFVENSGVFTFGDVNEREYRMGANLRDFTLFHSRRIGMERGQPVPILGGGRLTGRVGAMELGLLNMQTEAGPGSPAENFSVGRVRGSVLPGVDVGAIVVNRQGTAHARDPLGGATGELEHNRSYGVDMTGRFLQNLIVSGYLAGTSGSGHGGGDATARRLTAAWRDRLWDVSAMHKQVGDDFSPGVGFVRRTGMRHSYATLGAHPRPRLRSVQQVNPYVETDYITDLENRLETRAATLGFGVTFADGGAFTSSVTERYERIETPFPVSGGAVIGAGAYDYREGSVRYQSNQGKALSGAATLAGGEFFDGERVSLGLSGAWRASYRLTLELRADHNQISLPAADVTADVYGARLRYSHSTRLFGSAFVQYNQALDQVVTNVRANFVHAPLSDFFLVYTERRAMGGASPGVMERFLTAKITRMVAF
jgi:hypothetical protein